MIARVLLPFAALLLTADLAALGGGDKELEKLQGDWTMVSRELNGRKIPDEVAINKLTIKGDQWILTPGATASIKIDGSKDPKWIDLTFPRGTGTASPGIYKLEGDTLTICRVLAGKGERPKDFKSPEAGGNLVVYKRVGK
jgi:uncharacterized protein (TIGR03067 family)